MDFVKALHNFYDEIYVVQDSRDLELIKSVAEKYKSLPNDALIAATCKHYGIKKIATFDEDFRRVDFLEVVGL
ncbi:PIN domain-containing protein [Archaeoglobus fulgidus]|jgi:hypothetical protein|uniref:PIN domain-containing protein n=3 Tax=Archaeoglobus fulgidus TaxID=2234 RepID=O28070_ARCFU|nr:PIN domain-containing protein [Archaeoglobus fulgidus]AAB89055.1 conserved hypothetical protein, C-terminus [Archaeoglobus fulgidus DSM 4304]AIG99203.1 putative nucleic acid-binding protein [Archaeoglobus fulgidus DSM 8774]KUJ93616.1 MAG: hypothetical protein XD40_1167 [Archaeoglobus fulgidus]KUK07323.1 MAG: hypothetical protein XD48_0410 [Archaeoglobus fulgidus]